MGNWRKKLSDAGTTLSRKIGGSTNLDDLALTTLELASHDKDLIVFADWHGSDLEKEGGWGG